MHCALECELQYALMCAVQRAVQRAMKFSVPKTKTHTKKCYTLRKFSCCAILYLLLDVVLCSAVHCWMQCCAVQCSGQCSVRCRVQRSAGCNAVQCVVQISDVGTGSAVCSQEC